MKKIIQTLNNFLSRFKFQLVKTEEKPVLLSTAEACVKFLDANPVYTRNCYDPSHYVGDIHFVKDESGKVYFKDTKQDPEIWFCEYDLTKPSDKILNIMISETTFTQKELEDKLKTDELIRKAKKSNGKTTDTGRNDGDCR